MKTKQLLYLLAISLFSHCQLKKNSQGEDFSKNVNKVATNVIDESEKLTFFNNPRTPMESKFEQFPTGSVQPEGWILNMMKNDLEKGMVGALKDLYPGIKFDDLYRTARRGGMEDIPEMGDLVLTGAAWEKSIMWWNAETIGNWWDGYIRHAFLTKNKGAIKESKIIVQNLIDSQDEDGYIGIYKPNLRYQHEGSNGELWAQTTVFRAMLAYYEFTNDGVVLEAVEKAMRLTMSNYGETSKNPFNLKNAFGGVTHGMMLTDVCETLYRITGNIAYQDYATYLYKAFSTFSINRSFNDLRYPYLMEKDSLFEGHAVHTYEHIRTLVNAYYHTGYPELENAYKNMLTKLEYCILPSGAGHGNEWIAKLKANPDHTSSEYCTMLELRNSYGSLIQKTGNTHFADEAEKLTYNAMMGFRNLEGTALTYGKGDNSYVLDGHHHENGEKRKDPRYKYSPTHSEPAVCCVPNYTRNFTYFLEQMWMKSNGGIAAVMFGPSSLITEIDGSKVKITQQTNYPLSDEVTFLFEMEAPKKFTFSIRKPAWSESIEFKNSFGRLVEGYYQETRTWRNGDKITLQFKNKVKVDKARNTESYLQKGPLVFAYEIPHKEEQIKTYDKKGFSDYYAYPLDNGFKKLQLSYNPKFSFTSDKKANDYYGSKVFLETSFYNQKKKSQEKIKLIPMGKTVLRKVTFTTKTD